MDLDQLVNKLIMKYYLKITTTWFYDSHGSPDEGGIIKEVGTEFDYQGITIDGEYIYSEQYCNYLYSKDKTDLDELYGNTKACLTCHK